MTQQRFQRGMELILRGRDVVVERREKNDKVLIRDLGTNKFNSVAERDLFDALIDGQMLIVTREPQAGGKYVDDLALVSEDKVTIVKRRLRYVQKCVDSDISPGGVRLLQPSIDIVAQELQDPAPPSCASLYRWLSIYLKSGKDMRALLPKHRRGNQRRKFGSKNGVPHTIEQAERTYSVVRIIDDAVNEHYLNRKRWSVQAVFEIIQGRIHEENKYRAPDNKLPTPHISSLHDVISDIDSYTKDCARHGKRAADQKHKQTGRGIRPSRPLERVEIDHTKIDVFVIDDETLLPLGRPWVTTSIDKWSGMPLGRYIGFDGPGTNSVFQCLLHGIRPKTYLREKFPHIKNDWEAYGLPESIASDNGMEFLGGHYQLACEQLGIRLDFMPVLKPWFKGMVERFYRTQNTQLVHRVPGTTFSNIFEKGNDYDPKKHAIIRFSTFVELYDTWLVDIFSRQIQRGSEIAGPRNIPALSWKEGIEEWPPSVPASNIDIDIILRMREYRTIQHYGIDLFGIRYNDPALAVLRQELNGKKVLVKYDASNLGMIYVADVRNGTYIPASAQALEYAEGLPEYQHNIIKRYRRNYLEGEENEASLIEAKQRIQQIIESELKYVTGMKAIARTSKYKQIDSRPEKLASRAVVETSQTNGNQPIPRLLGSVTASPENTLFDDAAHGSFVKEAGVNLRPETSDTVNPRRSDERAAGAQDALSNEASYADYDAFEDEEWTASHDLPVKRNTI